MSRLLLAAGLLVPAAKAPYVQPDCTYGAFSSQDAPWRTVQVPGSRATTEAPGADGVAWYRAWVRVDDRFFAKHERNLFEESVELGRSEEHKLTSTPHLTH